MEYVCYTSTYICNLRTCNFIYGLPLHRINCDIICKCPEIGLNHEHSYITVSTMLELGTSHYSRTKCSD